MWVSFTVCLSNCPVFFSTRNKALLAQALMSGSEEILIFLEAMDGLYSFPAGATEEDL